MGIGSTDYLMVNISIANTLQFSELMLYIWAKIYLSAESI